jgi:hypothetical protein
VRRRLNGWVALDAVSRVTNNGDVVRKSIAAALVLALQASVLTAPLVHAHPDEHATPHHDGRAVHSHWSGHADATHPGDAPAIGADDHDRAVFLNPFVAVTTTAVVLSTAAHLVFAVAVPRERAAHRVAEVVRSHDPPLATSLSPRAPPAFLS